MNTETNLILEPQMVIPKFRFRIVSKPAGPSPQRKVKSIDFSNVNFTIARPKIRRPQNAFIVFARRWRCHLAKRFPCEINTQISKRLGEIWRALSTSQKEKYYDASKVILVEHKKKYPHYVYNPMEAKARKAYLKNKKKCWLSVHSSGNATTNVPPIKAPSIYLNQKNIFKSTFYRHIISKDRIMSNYTPNSTNVNYSSETEITSNTGLYDTPVRPVLIKLLPAAENTTKQRIQPLFALSKYPLLMSKAMEYQSNKRSLQSLRSSSEKVENISIKSGLADSQTNLRQYFTNFSGDELRVSRDIANTKAENVNAGSGRIQQTPGKLYNYLDAIQNSYDVITQDELDKIIAFQRISKNTLLNFSSDFMNMENVESVVK